MVGENELREAILANDALVQEHGGVEWAEIEQVVPDVDSRALLRVGGEHALEAADQDREIAQVLLASFLFGAATVARAIKQDAN